VTAAAAEAAAAPAAAAASAASAAGRGFDLHSGRIGADEVILLLVIDHVLAVDIGSGLQCRLELVAAL